MKLKKTIAGMLAAVTLMSSMAVSSYAVTPKFTDVNSKEWYANAVTVVTSHNMMAGTGNNKFSPSMTMNRAMLVQVLYNHAGKPAVKSANAFTDVQKDAWYYNAVQWAAENKVVAGVGNKQFKPNDPITREQFATILFQYCEKNNDNPAIEFQVLENYSDAASISKWAYNGVGWAVDKMIMNGTDKNTLMPTATATRAEAAQMLSNMMEYVTEDHDYKLTSTIPATGKTDGENKYTCDICGNTKTETIYATGEDDEEECKHEYTEAVTQEATCVEAGIKTFTCSKCKDTYTEVIPATGHDYESKVTQEATETTEGVRTYTCKNCGDSYTEKIPATGKDHEHNYAAKTTKPATCTEAGVVTMTCSCGDSYTEELPAKGHDYTSTTSGDTVTYTCKNCGYWYQGPADVAGEHNWIPSATGKIVDKEAWDEDVITGYRKYYLCHWCGEKFYFDQFEESDKDTSPGQYNAAEALNDNLLQCAINGEYGGYGPTTGDYSLQKEAIYGTPIHHEEESHEGITEYKCTKCDETVNYKDFAAHRFDDVCKG